MNHLRSSTLLVLAWLLGACGPEAESPTSKLVVGFRAENGTVTEGERGEFFVGRVNPGATLDARILLKNVGEKSIALSPIEWLGGTSMAFRFAPPEVPVLEPGAQAEIEITFHPPRAGRFVSTLRVGTAGIRLVGVGETTPVTKEPRLVLVTDGPFDLDPVPFLDAYPLSSTERVWFVVEDASSDSAQVVDRVTVEALDGKGSADELDVIVDEAPTELPPSAPEGARLAELRFTPSSVGAKHWRVTLHGIAPIAPVSFEVRVETVLADACGLVPSTRTLSFGVVPPTETRELELQFTNEGEGLAGHCLVSEAGLTAESSPAFTVIEAFEVPRLVAPGETISVHVRYDASAEPAPTGPELRGVFSVVTNASAQPAVEVTIAAVISAPACLTLTPAPLDFGKVQPGCSSATRTIQVANSCATPVILDSFRIADAAGQPAGGPNCPGTLPCPEFFLVASPAIPPGGLEMLPGASPVTFQVKYRPIDLSADTGTLENTAHMGDTPGLALLPLTGVGDPVVQQTDVFVMDAPYAVDILFVISDSGSMLDDQVSVATNLDAYLTYLLGQNVDFRLGVISASPAAGVTLRNGPAHPDPVLTRSSPNLQAQFAAKVNVGTNGAGGPSCLEQALDAVTAPPANSPNVGFLRPDAALMVICISDSPDLSPMSATDYVDAFWSIKGFGQKARFSFNAIGGFTPSCSVANATLASVVTQTNGFALPLCDPDWSGQMGYGDSGFGWGRNEILTSMPDLSKGPIEVKVDGVVVPPNDAQGNTIWTYDSVANFIVFAPNYRPQPGQLIEVTYFSSCYP